MIAKLVINLDFTIEDIHKIREQNFERTKDITVEEKVAYYNNSGKEAEWEIGAFLLWGYIFNQFM